MDFKPNKKVQNLKLNNQISALAIAHYLKDHTHCDWKKMMALWLDGYTTTNSDYNTHPDYLKITITPKPRPNGGFWGGGGHGSPKNYETTIQYLMDHGYITFTHINGFKLLASTKKLKSTQCFGTKNFPVSSKNLTKYNHLNFG